VNHVEIKIRGEESWWERLRHYALLVRLHRPIGIFLLMWPTVWALWIAGEGQPPWQVVLIFVLGVVLMRSAGCAINDYADRNIDGYVLRTDQRPLVSGDVSPREALVAFVVLSLAAFALVLLLSWQTVLLALVALVFAAIYPFMKRYTHLPQVVLGAAFGWAIPMAFSAVTGTVPLDAWLLFAAALSWTLVYDTEYAMVDREDDLKIGVKSTAVLLGNRDRLFVGAFQVLMLVILVLVGMRVQLGMAYYIGLGVAALLFVRQQFQIRRREPAACFRAFLDNNCLGIAITLGLMLDYLL
jgi:4-hydroxybenzoate polyprenyltransferase